MSSTTRNLHRRPVYRSAAAILVLAVAFCAVATLPARAQPVVENLILNGEFDSNLEGWVREEDSRWDDLDWEQDPHSGSVTSVDWGARLWQCVTVEPDRYYRVSARAYPFGDDDDVLWIRDVTNESCPSSWFSDGFLTLTYFGPPVAWVPVAENFVMPSGITQAALLIDVNLAQNETHHFDHVEFGKIRPDAGVQMSVSDVELIPLEVFTIDVTFTSAYNGIQPELQISFPGDDWINLVDYDCEVGHVADVSQSGSHFFRWFNIPGDVHPYEHSCTITARANTGVAGTFDLRAVADCEGCDVDGDPANNEQTISMEIVPAPDVAATISVSEFPEAGDVVDVDISVTNVGTGSAGGSFTSVSVVLGLPLSLQSVTGPSCHFLTETLPGTVEGQTFLNGAQPDPRECTLTFEIPSDQPPAPLAAEVLTNIPGDYNPANNNDNDGTRIVRLLVDRVFDGWDRAPGDGVCEQTEDSGDCSLRAAVMEANALAAATGRAFTVQLPYSPSTYVLTRTTGDDAQLYGSLSIKRRMLLMGLPHPDTGARPLVAANFPSDDADRLIRIGNPAGFVRIENVHLRGQGLVPTDTDGLGTDGGLVLHQSGELVLRNVTLAEGATDGRGGAIHSASDDSNGHLTLERVKVYDNVADQGGGVAFIPEGFAIFTLEESEIYDNDAANVGGGIFAGGIGAGALPFVGIERSTIHDNEAIGGGGMLFNHVTLATVANSTVSGNVGLLQGGAIAAVQETTLAVNNSTIAFNAAAPGNNNEGDGGGIYQATDADVTLYNSVVSSNTGYQTCSPPNPPLPPICIHTAANCYGSLDSAGYNAIVTTVDSECTFNSEPTDDSTHVQLAPLADNGGLAPTHAPASFNAIVDAGDPNCLIRPGGDPLTIDQRGALRPNDGNDDGTAQCDRGAYELSESGRISVTVDDDSLGRVNSSPSGIFCGAGTGNQCSALFAFEAEVTLTATVASGSGGEFAGWEGACAGQGNPCTLTAAGDQETTALFAPVSTTRTLTVESNEPGGGVVMSSPAGIDCPGQCEAEFETASTVQLTATPSPGFEFLGFSGSGCSGAAPCTVTMDLNRQVWAEFAQATGTVTVTLAGGGSGSVSSDIVGVSCPSDCDHGWPVTETVTLSAQPTFGSHFAGWSGACSGNGDCVLDMSQAPFEVTATFSEEQPGDVIFVDRFE